MTGLDLALSRWSVTCRRWDEFAAGMHPDLGAFLAGWYLRKLGCEMPNPLESRDSFLAGWSDSGIYEAINKREIERHETEGNPE